MAPRTAVRFAAGALGVLVAAGVGGTLPVGPASAAEAGGARLAAAASETTPIGNCIASASTSGRYGITCAGSRYRTSFQSLLEGAPPPSCWLVDPATADDTPRSGATPGAGVRRVLAAAGTPAPEPGSSPTGFPAGTPTGAATSTPTGTPTGTPTETPEQTVTGTPTGTPTETLTEIPPTPTPTVRPPQEYLRICLAPPPDPSTGVPTWNTDLERATVWFSPDDPDRPPLWEELTAGQQAYADLVDRREGTIQVNGLVVSPSTTPRIGQGIAFSVRNDVLPPVVGRGDTLMRAQPLDLTVWPYPGAAPVTCSGTGERLAAGTTERTGPGTCSYTYRRTSAGSRSGQDGDTFAVRGVSRWRIQISHDRGDSWSDYLVASVEADLGLRVTEVQTLVVPFTAAELPVVR